MVQRMALGSWTGDHMVWGRIELELCVTGARQGLSTSFLQMWFELVWESDLRVLARPLVGLT